MNGLAFWYRWFRRAPDYPDHKDWQAAGWHIKQYFEFQQIPVCERIIVSYSHGIQPVLYACAYGLELARLLTVGGPIRADMQESAEIARRRIGRWLSVNDPFDVIQQGGQWFDGGRLVPVQCHPLADQRDLIPGIGHGKVLEDPRFFHYWDRLGWADWLRGST